MKDENESLGVRGEEESKVNIITIDPMKEIPVHEVKKEADLIKEHKCSICTKVFVNQRYLSKHMSKHPMIEIPAYERKKKEDPIKEKQCSICKKIFVKQRYLSQHMSKHILPPPPKKEASKVNEK